MKLFGASEGFSALSKWYFQCFPQRLLRRVIFLLFFFPLFSKMYSRTLAAYVIPPLSGMGGGMMAGASVMDLMSIFGDASMVDPATRIIKISESAS